MRTGVHAVLSQVMLCAATCATAAPQLAIVNADIFTADSSRPRAEAVAIENGNFRAVGSNASILELVGSETRIIDAGGRLTIPGLIEAHVHLEWNLPFVPLPMPHLPFPGPSGEQALAAIETTADSPGDWIAAFIGSSVARDRRNWRAALDAVVPDRPIVLRGFWGHTTILNSAALKRLRIDENVVDPIGGWWGRDEYGRLDGRAYESAEDIVRQKLATPDPESLIMLFREAAQRYASWGVTSVHLMNSGASLEVTLNTLERAHTPQKWTIYSWAGAVQRIPDAWNALESAPEILPERVRIEGPKWILDGTGVEQNALQRKSYVGRPGWHGKSNHTDQQLREILQIALRRPEQMALHVVGDAETDRLFNMMESLASPAEWQAKRIRVEHGDGIRADTLEQAVRLGISVIQNPTHLLSPPVDDDLTPLFDRPSLLNSLLLAGIPLALGSDGGPEQANPYLNMMLASMYSALPDEAITREQALMAYTSGGAFVEHQEQNKGRIASGMAADLAILSQDILTVPMETLPSTRSLLTLVNGEIVYQDSSWLAPAQHK